jgi:hypothetical protein
MRRNNSTKAPWNRWRARPLLLYRHVLILDRLQARERSAMRALIVLSLMAIVFGSSVCEAGMSTGPHRISASAAMAPAASHATVGHRRGRVHHARRIGGPIAAIGRPIAAIGGAIGGLFRR